LMLNKIVYVNVYTPKIWEARERNCYNFGWSLLLWADNAC
jgi:hypothetical protein